MRYHLNKRTSVILIVVLFTFLIGGMYITNILPSKEKSQPTDKTQVVDTKSQLNTGDAGVNQEIDPYNITGVDTTVVRVYKTKLFGIPNFIEKLYESREYISSIQSDTVAAFLRYGDDVLKNKYTTLTLIPNSLVIDHSMITGLLLLGDTDKSIPFTIKVMGDRRAYVTINDTLNRVNFIYAGGLNNVTRERFFIKQLNYSRNSFEVTAKDKEAALSYISSIGYKISDLTITFTDYRSPFE